LARSIGSIEYFGGSAIGQTVDVSHVPDLGHGRQSYHHSASRARVAPKLSDGRASARLLVAALMGLQKGRQGCRLRSVEES
jgi:hypothetical protein